MSGPLVDFVELTLVKAAPLIYAALAGVLCERAGILNIALEGQLTVSVHMTDTDSDAAHRLLPVLEEKAGRILINGFGTGVEVCPAMVHGGPFPATSDSRTTSVGTLAIRRFLRPVAYQDLPDALRPESVKEKNPLGIPRLINGRLQGG